MDIDQFVIYLREHLSYDPDTGVFIRKKNTRGGKAGEVAGCINNIGYRQIYIYKNIHLAHRLAWVYVYGIFPTNDIDHINGIREDNRISNLRDVENNLNQQNQRTPKGRVGLLGVSTAGKKYRAVIRVDGKHIRLGLFDDPLVAHEKYKEAKRQLHPGCTI